MIVDGKVRSWCERNQLFFVFEFPLYLRAVFSGEFGYSDVACGALCRLGKGGVEEITLPLNDEQKAEMDAATAKIKEQISWVTL